MKNFLRFFCFLWPILLLLLAGCQSATEPATAPITAAETMNVGTPLPDGYRAPLWTFSTDGEIWSSPSVADGIVYFGNDQHVFFAVDIATHDLRWKLTTRDIIRSRPAIADGIVYFSSDDGMLFAVDAYTGDQKWIFDLGKSPAERLPIPKGWDYLQSSPAVADGVVYSGSGTNIFYAIDVATGLEKWHKEIGLRVRSTPAVVNGVVFFGDWRGTLYALDAETGAEKWTFSTKGSINPSPAVVNGVVYIGSRYPCLYAVDAATGKQKWCFPYPSGAPFVESSATLSDGTVFVGSSDWSRVIAVDAASGSLKWSFPVKGDPWSSPSVSEGVVYIGSTGGFFYAIDAVTGREKWRLQTDDALTTVDPARVDGGVVSSPAIADGIVFFGSLDGKFYAVSTAP